MFSWRANWMATVIGRAGIAVKNNLFYVKGGYAGVNNRLTVTDTVPPYAVRDADALAQRLDRRRRLGIRHHRELDRRTRVRLFGLRAKTTSSLARPSEPTPSMPSPATFSRPWSA